MKITSFLLLIFAVYSCSTNKESEEVLISDKEIEVIVEEEVSNDFSDEVFEVVEEEEQALTPYQKAVLTQENKAIFPQGVVLRRSENLTEINLLEFVEILQVTKSWFLSKYVIWEGETENFYFFTFDYNGNQLDAKYLYTLAIDLNAEVVFKNENEFEVINKIDDVELDENDNLVILSSHEEIEKFIINEKGEILVLQQAIEE